MQRMGRIFSLRVPGLGCQMLASIRRALKPDGRLVLLEFRKEDPKVPIREEHKMTVAVAKQELAADGFTLDKLVTDLPWQHILFFKKTAE